MSIHGLLDHLRSRVKEPSFAVVSLLYIAFCIFSSVWWIVNFQPSYLLMSSLFILFVPLILIAEYLVGIKCGIAVVGIALFIAAGSILGTPFDLYTAFPHLDTLLHGLSGLLFACVGFALAVRLFGEVKSRKTLVGALVFAASFSLAVAVLWEIHEYMCTVFLDMEMMDDTYVFDIKSFVLGGGRAEPMIIDGITKTVIYYGNGESLVMDGYLDLGLIDTLADMIICTIGAATFTILAALGHSVAPALRRALIPALLDNCSYDKCEIEVNT